MKKIFILGLLSLSATAFSQVCEVDMVDSRSRIVSTFRAYGDPNTCIEGMKECRKTIRLSPQLGGVDCIRRTQYNPPIPSPIPTPIPPRPQPIPTPIYGVSVTGMVEDRLFTMVARDASELYVNCLTDIRRYSGSADELFFSANNNRFVAASTGGWYNDNQICSILEQEARRQFVTAYTAPMRIVGSLEREPFQIQAFDRAELLTGCIAAFTATRQGSTDELTYSLNGAPFQRITTSGWWNSPARACKAMILHLDSQLR